MAMSRICTLGVALFAHVSGHGFEWDQYMKEHDGGEFSQYSHAYTKDPESGKYADQYSKDRLAQAQKYEDQWLGSSAPAMEQAALLVEAPARGQEAVNHTAEALAAEKAAKQDGEAAVAELRSWDAKLEQDLAQENFSLAVAQGIVAKVASAHEAQRAKLEHRFGSAMKALEDPEALAAANSSRAEKAEHAAEDAMEELKRLSHEEAKDVHSTLKSIRKAGEARARALWKEARKAAHKVHRSGMAAARAERKAGAEERVYERKQLDTEEASERLLRQAEKYAESAEDHVEEQFGKVKAHLESLMEGLRAKVREARKAREERYQQAKVRVQEAEKDEDHRAGSSAAALDQAALLVEAPTRGQEAVNHTAEALAAEKAAKQDGEAAVAELRSWDAKLEQDLAQENFSLAVAQGIVGKVASAHEAQRAKLEHRFGSAMKALEVPEALAAANSSRAEKAEHAAEDAMEELKRLSHEEAKDVHSTLKSIRKAGEARARDLWKEARKAAHKVHRSGMAAARAERKAGAEERVYERKQLDTEEASERLLRQAEKYAESAEDHVEEQFGKVKAHLESLMEGLRAKVREARKAREERYQQAKVRVQEARRAAKEKAASAAAAGTTAFLAGSSLSRGDGALVAPLACVTMLAAMFAVLVLRFRRGALVVEHPLLG